MSQLEPDWALREPAEHETVLVFAGNRLVLHEGTPGAPAGTWRRLLEGFDDRERFGPFTIGRESGQWIHALSIPEGDLPEGLETQELRRFLLRADHGGWQRASTAAQLLHWVREHRYCGRCGQVTTFHPGERALRCEYCNHNWYPRLSPCVIVVVRRGRQILLARAPHYPEGLHSLVAGTDVVS